jgi:NAD(P)-dependent dehydrogenase (short-subunit alcohol dehydrogenase family)
MPSLKGKTVLVGGRSSGTAKAIALAVSEDGGRVIAAGLTRKIWPAARQP